MPDNSMLTPDNPQINPNAPHVFTLDGLGAFVLLDYATSNNTDRYEHCVVFLPSEWGTMHDLLKSPDAFMKLVLGSYTDVLDQNGTKVSAWPFAAPITIHIEPLTAPSPKNLATLASLCGLYPQMQLALDLAKSDGFSLNHFRQLVIDGAKSPATEVEMERLAKAHQEKLAKLIKPQKDSDRLKDQNFDKADSQRIGPGSGFGLDAQPKLKRPTELFYVLEYALNTRLLTIKYIPRPRRPSDSPWYFFRRLTDVTLNPVGLLNVEFIHYDMEFDGDRTHELVAEERANLAMDFIEHPPVLNTIIGNGAVHNGTNTLLTYHVLSDMMTSTGNVLKQKHSLGSTDGPTFTIPNDFDATVILDSVLPDPSKLPTGVYDPTNVPQGTDPVAPPCTVVYYVNGVPYYIIIKNYG